jgi:hypothetical protein
MIVWRYEAHLQLACSIPEKAEKHSRYYLISKALRFAFHPFPGR